VNRFERTTFLPARLDRVFEFFGAPENLGRITPASMHFRITRGPDRRLREGDRIEYSLRVFGLPMRWKTHITMWRDGEVFADFQERGPYKYWLHTHRFREVEGGVEMHDAVDYELPLGWLGELIAGKLVRRELNRIFDFRAQAVRQLIG
jgi:ligand-binding SRPBCC domain-containing protein